MAQTPPVTSGGRVTYDFVTRAIARTLGNPSKGYFLLLGGALTLLAIGITCLVFILRYGLGLAGYAHPVYWAVFITCFVFWVGIAHSGTLISAILYLFRSGWRTAVYRTAEAMTVFAVMTAGLFPLIHIGRQWYFYWLIPYPNERGLWPNFKSPLIWDEFAIGTYFTVSTVFLIMGLIPDIAAARDLATGWRKKLYALTSIGWRGTNEQWRHYTRGYLYLAALATPLVLSVHSVVSWDFAMAHGARVARDDVRAVFRGRRDLLGVRDGDHAYRAHPAAVPPGRSDHRRSLRESGQTLPAHRHDRRIRVRDGVLRRLVQRQSDRARGVLVSGVRADPGGPAGP